MFSLNMEGYGLAALAYHQLFISFWPSVYIILANNCLRFHQQHYNDTLQHYPLIGILTINHPLLYNFM